MITATSLHWCGQSRAREQRDPIEFSFHDFDFLCVFVFEFSLSLA